MVQLASSAEHTTDMYKVLAVTHDINCKSLWEGPFDGMLHTQDNGQACICGCSTAQHNTVQHGIAGAAWLSCKTHYSILRDLVCAGNNTMPASEYLCIAECSNHKLL